MLKKILTAIAFAALLSFVCLLAYNSREFSFYYVVYSSSVLVVLYISYWVGYYKRLSKENKDKDQNIATRMRTLSDSLNNSANELSDLQEKMKEQIAFVDNLVKQADEAEQIININKIAMDAIINKIGAMQKGANQRSFSSLFSFLRAFLWELIIAVISGIVIAAILILLGFK